MNHISSGSLSQTVDAVNAAIFDGHRWPLATKRAVAHWIVARQGLPGAYAATFAGFPAERTRGIVVFTGERITSASARHILGEEASRDDALAGSRCATDKKQHADQVMQRARRHMPAAWSNLMRRAVVWC